MKADPKKDAAWVGLPIRDFLYTTDQIAFLLGVTEKHLKDKLIHYDGVSTGVRKPYKMLARSISAPNEKPDWRVAERELQRWLRSKGFRFHERAYIKD